MSFASQDLFSVFSEKDTNSKDYKQQENESQKKKKNKSKKRKINDLNKEDSKKENQNNSSSAPPPAKLPRVEPVNVTAVVEKEKKKTASGEDGKPSESGAEKGENDEGLVDGEVLPGLDASRESCSHEVAYPPNYTPPTNTNNVKRPQAPPAKQYPFVLDPFQREAIRSLEQNQSVLVSAHTSAGKTAVAEYAIAMAFRDNQRVIYTSPIKALSNQKYREFSEEFKDVGLMTGDTTINPNANCIVMTTEILRSMLYRGSTMLREIAWVVFDEVHYMRDKNRGVVWEETIILLPDTVRYVFLSATIPNATEFAEWIARLHNQPCHVVYTDFRPVPLQHYLYPRGGDGVHLIVDEKGRFREKNFQQALLTLASKGGEEEGSKAAGRVGKQAASVAGTESHMYNVVKMIMERNFHPVIVFGFSKRQCEENALQMAKLNFNDEQEQELVGEVFRNAVESLSEDDQALPQVKGILPLLKRGIAMHHSGLLPILKEIIEILFQENLIKCLFATETFAMGLNMPARTVVFTALRKYDGTQERWLSGGEYIQMSGRAGRRGLDTRGIVIMMADQQINPTVVKHLVGGTADRLDSTFHLSYNMLLNLLRVEEVTPEYMMERSFFQYQLQKHRPELEDRLEQLKEQAEKVNLGDDPDTALAYFDQLAHLDNLRRALYRTLSPKYRPFLKAGRLVRVVRGAEEWGWGLVVQNLGSRLDVCVLACSSSPDGGNSDDVVDNNNNNNNNTKKKKKNKNKNKNKKHETDKDNNNQEHHHDDHHPSSSSAAPSSRPVPVPLNLPADHPSVTPTILQFRPEDIQFVSSVRSMVGIKPGRKDAAQVAGSTLREVLDRLQGEPPLLGPDDLGVRDPSVHSLWESLAPTVESVSQHPLHGTDRAARLIPLCARRKAIEREKQEVEKMLDTAQKLAFQDHLKKMMRVLRRLGFSDANNVIQLKGRVACEINTADELLCTELLFNGCFNNMTPEVCAGVLSCLVLTEDSSEAPVPAKELVEGFNVLKMTARRIAEVSEEAKLEIEPDKYVSSFKPHMMELTYQWCKGSKFAALMSKTDLFEGSLIRAMRRLEELLRQMCVAAKTIGDEGLENKFLEAINMIKRDIVFAASLYL